MAVGLEQTVYSVAESDGSVEVCIFATAPPNDVLSITASTESASASKRLSQIANISCANRNVCVSQFVSAPFL